MEEVTQLAKSPTFWFSSVVIAFLMSLFASYVKDWLEVLKNKLSKKRRIRNEKNEQDFQQKLEELKQNPALLSIYLSDIVFQKVRNVLYYFIVYTTMFFALSNWVNGNKEAALSFAAISFLSLAIPVQLTASKINKMSRLVNEISGEGNERFKH